MHPVDLLVTTLWADARLWPPAAAAKEAKPEESESPPPPEESDEVVISPARRRALLLAWREAEDTRVLDAETALWGTYPGGW